MYIGWKIVATKKRFMILKQMDSWTLTVEYKATHEILQKDNKSNTNT